MDMTDKQALFTYRLKEADETLHDAVMMLRNGISPRSVINRAYFSMFYALQALFVHSDLNPKTSNHSGIIAIFDREFVHAGKVDLNYSKMLHRLFDTRQEFDYKELAESSPEEAAECVSLAGEFIAAVKSLIEREDRP